MTPTENNSPSNDARIFISELRGRQAISAQTLKGRPGLPPVQRVAIRAITVSYAVAGKPPKLAQTEMIHLLERFEEMARRQKMIINAGLRPHILSILLTELWVNKHSLNMPTEKLLAATAYHGAIGAKLPKEFPQFFDTPGFYRHAVANYPATPREFLRKAQTMLGEISTDKQFAEFLETPGIFKQAVVRAPSDPRGFLVNLQNTMKAMAHEEEFAEFAGAPGIFKQAAISNSSNPREYVRKIKGNLTKIKMDPNFSCFAKTPGIFLQAVLRNPSDPSGFLKKIKYDITAMTTEKEFTEFHDKPSVLQHAALHNTSDPREFLRRNPKALWHAMLVKNRKTSDKRKELSQELVTKKPKK